MPERQHDGTAGDRREPKAEGPPGPPAGGPRDSTYDRPRVAASERSRAATAGAVLAAVAALGAFVLVGDVAPASAQQPSADAPQAERGEAATVDARAERPVGAVTDGAIADGGLPGAATADDTQEKSLYERLGGVYPIASVVDVFIDLLLHNDVLNENPAIRKARDEVPAPGLKYHVTAMVCQATGGPCEYTGRSMEEAHAHLNIGEREWDAMLSDLRRTLNDFQVPEQEQEELVAIVQSTKDDIVVED